MTEEQAPRGSPVVGRYQLHTQIAAGGMASVHLGILLGHAGFSRTVAIKRLHPHLAQDPDFVSMLLDRRGPAAYPPSNVVSTSTSWRSKASCWSSEHAHGESLSRLLSRLRKAG
jgi:serine/threonine-protein kinase